MERRQLWARPFAEDGDQEIQGFESAGIVARAHAALEHHERGKHVAGHGLEEAVKKGEAFVVTGHARPLEIVEVGVESSCGRPSDDPGHPGPVHRSPQRALEKQLVYPDLAEMVPWEGAPAKEERHKVHRIKVMVQRPLGLGAKGIHGAVHLTVVAKRHAVPLVLERVPQHHLDGEEVPQHVGGGHHEMELVATLDEPRRETYTAPDVRRDAEFLVGSDPGALCVPKVSAGEAYGQDVPGAQSG